MRVATFAEAKGASKRSEQLRVTPKPEAPTAPNPHETAGSKSNKRNGSKPNKRNGSKPNKRNGSKHNKPDGSKPNKRNGSKPNNTAAQTPKSPTVSKSNNTATQTPNETDDSKSNNTAANTTNKEAEIKNTAIAYTNMINEANKADPGNIYAATYGVADSCHKMLLFLDSERQNLRQPVAENTVAAIDGLRRAVEKQVIVKNPNAFGIRDVLEIRIMNKELIVINICNTVKIPVTVDERLVARISNAVGAHILGEKHITTNVCSARGKFAVVEVYIEDEKFITLEIRIMNRNLPTTKIYFAGKELSPDRIPNPVDISTVIDMLATASKRANAKTWDWVQEMRDETTIVLLLRICIEAFSQAQKRKPTNEEVIRRIRRTFYSINNGLELQHGYTRYFASMPQAISVIIDSGLYVIEASSERWHCIDSARTQRAEARGRRLGSYNQEDRKAIKNVSDYLKQELDKKTAKDRGAFLKNWTAEGGNRTHRILKVPGTFVTFKPSGDFKCARVMCACRFACEKPAAGAVQPNMTSNLSMYEAEKCSEVLCVLAYCASTKTPATQYMRRKLRGADIRPRPRPKR